MSSEYDMDLDSDSSSSTTPTNSSDDNSLPSVLVVKKSVDLYSGKTIPGKRTKRKQSTDSSVDVVDFKKAQKHKGKTGGKLNDPGILLNNDGMDSMAEEMNAMKQVFIKISEKKLAQKELRKDECRSLYKEAFKEDVDEAFKQMSKKNNKTIRSLALKIHEESNSLEIAQKEFCKAHIEYEQQYVQEMKNAKAEIDGFQKLLHQIDERYNLAKIDLNREFERMHNQMKKSMMHLKQNINEIHKDKTYTNIFKGQLDRLQ